MPISEFRECFIYEQIEPFGGRRMDIQTGILASTVANILCGQKKKQFMPEDFMPSWEPKPEAKPQTPEQQLRTFKLVQQVQNALIRERQND